MLFNSKKGDVMIGWIVAAAIGGGALVGGVWLQVERKKEPPQTVDVADVVEKVLALHKPSENLTEPDLLKVPCSMEYISTNGDSLCREMFCRMTTRGVDSKTSGQECEAISNIMNKSVVLKTCESQPDPKACIELFDRRL